MLYPIELQARALPVGGFAAARPAQLPAMATSSKTASNTGRGRGI
jgi:hypothetical protein